MSINKEEFIKWAEKNFDSVIIHGDQIKLNSIFIEDKKNHLWVSIEKNAYHCWKTDKSGNLYDLVVKKSKYTYQEAMDLIGDNNELRKLEKRVEDFFNKKQEVVVKKTNKISFPEHVYKISELEKNNKFRIRAEEYLKSRCIDSDLFVCTFGEYCNRIFIPYYDKNGNLIYWNSRSLSDKGIRYLGPRNSGIGKSDVVYMTTWNTNKLYLTEGEFDALSLFQCGLNGCAIGGKEVYDKQLEIIKKYQICICFDTDKSGGQALNKVGKNIASKVKDLSFVRPPEGYKDWNCMLVKCGKNVMKTYIEMNEKYISQDTFNKLRIL